MPTGDTYNPSRNQVECPHCHQVYDSESRERDCPHGERARDFLGESEPSTETVSTSSEHRPGMLSDELES